MYHSGYDIWDALDRFNNTQEPDLEAARQLFQESPESATGTYLRLRSLLHRCMENHATALEWIQLLAESYPESIVQPDEDEYTPLHLGLVAENPPSLRVVEFLVHKEPETLILETSEGKLTLHLACQGSASVDIIDFLIRSDPYALGHRDDQGKCPLEYAVSREYQAAEICQRILATDKAPLSLPDSQGLLLLHRVIADQPVEADSLIPILVEAFPGALRLQNQQKRTPLLTACMQDSPLTQVFALVRAWPEQLLTCMTFEFNGELLPAVVPAASLYDLEMWSSRYPDAIMAPDIQGRLPLHYCAAGNAVHHVRHLLSKNSHAACIADSYGRTPLHYAAISTDSRIVDLLVDANVSALVTADVDGRLPWHYADCARNDHVADQTLTHYPDLELDLELVPDQIRWDIAQSPE